MCTALKPNESVPSGVREVSDTVCPLGVSSVVASLEVERARKKARSQDLTLEL